MEFDDDGMYTFGFQNTEGWSSRFYGWYGGGGGGGHQGLGACASFVSKYFFALYVVSSEGGYRKRAFDVVVRTNRCLETQMP